MATKVNFSENENESESESELLNENLSTEVNLSHQSSPGGTNSIITDKTPSNSTGAVTNKLPFSITSTESLTEGVTDKPDKEDAAPHITGVFTLPLVHSSQFPVLNERETTKQGTPEDLPSVSRDSTGEHLTLVSMVTRVTKGISTCCLSMCCLKNVKFLRL